MTAMNGHPFNIAFAIANLIICERAHLIKSPSLLFPSGVSTGSIVNISSEILDTFDTQSPQKPMVELRNVIQTSITLEWPKLELATAKLRSLDLCRDRQRVAAIPSEQHSTKVSGFQPDTEYTFQLVIRTTAGVCPSNVLRVRTHTMTNNSALREMGTKWSNKNQIDTTFVCTTMRLSPSLPIPSATWPRDLKIPNREIDGMAQLLVIEFLLVLGDSPSTITQPKEKDPIVRDPIAQAPRCGEARNSLFEFCMRLLPVPTLPKDKPRVPNAKQSSNPGSFDPSLALQNTRADLLAQAVSNGLTPSPATPTIIQDTFDLSTAMASPTRSVNAPHLTQVPHSMDDDSITTVQAREGDSVDALTTDGIPGQTDNMQIDRGEVPSSTVMSLSQLRSLAMPLPTSVDSTPITRLAQEVSEGVALTPFDTMLGQAPATAAEDTAVAEANPSGREESTLSALGQWLESPSQAHEAPGAVNQPSEITARPEEDIPWVPGPRGNTARNGSRKAARATAQLRKARRGGLRRL
ncbi:hypothetical protein L226DRAFT_575412 [Lentinus tigrinus ALCF2SS1-7]|uniref:uncharacterized protein n=1 Tax=Lentinus tigrinus ALCF2SS1-7 TaxID=1328758 RepID=UPI001165F04A|nr:hypothetical protein L226DRAFT_575412 [Lentinus tigrinus ALCF2SS1-7]